MYPVKLNQNYVYKRGRVKKFISKYQEEHGTEPTTSQISAELGMSEKVINNILSINNGENFQFISFQSVNKEGSDDPTSENYVENKLVNEYLEETVSDYNMTNYELSDLLGELKKLIAEKDFNMFVDKHLNGLSYSDVAKKYNLKFPSSAKYIIERVEKQCKELLV
jgi:DNA-directed RNA polymerase specialized sigma subunit